MIYCRSKHNSNWKSPEMIFCEQLGTFSWAAYWSGARSCWLRAPSAKPANSSLSVFSRAEVSSSFVIEHYKFRILLLESVQPALKITCFIIFYYYCCRRDFLTAWAQIKVLTRLVKQLSDKENLEMKKNSSSLLDELTGRRRGCSYARDVTH